MKYQREKFEELLRVSADSKSFCSCWKVQIEFKPDGNTELNVEKMYTADKLDKKKLSEKDLLYLIDNVLSRLLINSSYEYAREVIFNKLDDLKGFRYTSYYYSCLERKNGVSMLHIERKINEYIKKVWQNGNEKMFKEIFGYTKNEYDQPPTDVEFLDGVAEYILKNYLIQK